MFRIGEFSHIARVTTKLLRFYDRIGLLPPTRIDASTGYRYYSAEQLPRLNRILALKELGFSLDEIIDLVQAEGSIEAVQFFVRSRLLTTLTAPPYRFIWRRVPPGEHLVTARARDVNGLIGNSEPNVVVVQTER